VIFLNHPTDLMCKHRVNSRIGDGKIEDAVRRRAVELRMITIILVDRHRRDLRRHPARYGDPAVS